jgi:hypothetical protein
MQIKYKKKERKKELIKREKREGSNNRKEYVYWENKNIL